MTCCVADAIGKRSKHGAAGCRPPPQRKGRYCCGMSGSGPDGNAVLGRVPELALLAGLVADANAGRGRCVLIEGEPGIGKTVLLDAVLEQARAAQVSVAHGTCHEFGQDAPAQVLLEALGLDAGPTPSGARRVGAPSAVTSAATAVERVLSEVDLRCSDGPLAQATDDLDRADETSLLLWQRLCRVTGSSPLLLVATSRLRSNRPQLDRLRQIVRSQRGVIITLGELDAAAVHEFAGRVLGATPGPRLAERLEFAGGHPVHLREMLESLTRAGAVTIENGTAELLDPACAPETSAPADSSQATAPMAEIVGARLDFLSESTGRMLRSAALLGQEFAVTDLSGLLRTPSGALIAPVQEAIAAGVLVPSGSRLRFRHGILRQSLYESVSPSTRERRRRVAIQALMDGGAPVERAAELVLGVEAPGAWEAQWAVQQAKSLRRRAPQVAVRLFDHLLAHAAPRDGDRDVLLDELAKAQFALGRYAHAAAVCRKILDTAVDPRRRGPAVWTLACSLAWTGRLPEAATVVEGALAAPETVAPWRARLVACAAIIAVWDERYVEARDAISQARTEGERLTDGVAVGYALYAQACLSLLNSDPQGCLDAVARALTSIEARPEMADLKLLLYAKMIDALVVLDQFAGAQAVLLTARTLGARPTVPARPERHLLSAAQLAYQQGCWDDTLQMLAAIGYTEAELAPHGIGAGTLVHGIAALISAHRDDGDESARYLTVLSGDVPRVSSVRLVSSYALLADAVLAERDDRPKQGLATLARVLDPAYDGMENRLLLLPSLVRLAVDLSEVSLAETAVQFAYGQTGSTGPASAAAVTRWCRGLLEGDRAAVAGAADYFRSVGRKLELGHALEDAVVLSSIAGRAGAVRDELAEALAVYADLGAAWDVRRMTIRLRPHGVRVSSPHASRPTAGWAALTDAERRVALLVGAGRSNPEIAAALSLSRRTVETHVSRVLAKLSVRSRREVVGLLPEEEPAAGAGGSDR